MVFSRALSVAAIGAAACTVPAFAGVSNPLGITQVDGTPLPKITYPIPAITNPLDAPGKTDVTVGAAAPVQTAIHPDPANVWLKNFSWDVNNRGVVDGDQINLMEWFEINLNEDGFVPRNIPISDWHEQIEITTSAVPGSMFFAGGASIEFDFGSGLVSPQFPVIQTNSAGEIWFDWFSSDIGPIRALDGDFGSVIVKITKTIEYDGPDIAPGAIPFFDFRITEYPTPAPGTMLPLAALPFVLRRRR